MQQWSSLWSASTVLATLILQASFQMQGASGDRGLRRVARLAGAGFAYKFRTERHASASVHKLRVSLAVQMHFGGTWQAAWVAQRSGTLNIQCRAARLHQVPASTLRAGHGPRVLRFGGPPCPGPDTETATGTIPGKIS